MHTHVNTRTERATFPAPHGGAVAQGPDAGPRPNVFVVKARPGLNVAANWWTGVVLSNAMQIIQQRYDL